MNRIGLVILALCATVFMTTPPANAQGSWYREGTPATCDSKSVSEDNGDGYYYVPFDKPSIVMLKRETGWPNVWWLLDSGKDSWMKSRRNDVVSVNVGTSEIGTRTVIKSQKSKFLKKRGNECSIHLIAAAYSYRLIYDANGGTGGPAGETIEWTSDFENFSSHTFTVCSTMPERIGYSFMGWYDSPVGGERIMERVTVEGEVNKEVVVTLYAHWKPNTYKVRFNANRENVDGSMKEQVFRYGSRQRLTENSYVYNVHKFLEWNTKPDGTGTSYTDGQPVSNLTVTDNGIVELYADWAPHRIVFDANGGSETPENILYDEEDEITLPVLDDSTKPGSHFLGWKTVETGGNWPEGYSYGKVYRTISKGKKGNVKLEAIWDDGVSDFRVSVSGIEDDREEVTFRAEATKGRIKGWIYTFVLGKHKPSKLFKGAPVGDYTVTALEDENSSCVRSEKDNSSRKEQHNTSGGYEFKFAVYPMSDNH